MKIFVNKISESVCEIEAAELAATKTPFAVVANEFHGGCVEDYYKSLPKAEAHTRCGGDCRCGGGGVMFDVTELPDYTDPETDLTPAECAWIKLPTGEMLPVLNV